MPHSQHPPAGYHTGSVPSLKENTPRRQLRIIAAVSLLLLCLLSPLAAYMVSTPLALFLAVYFWPAVIIIAYRSNRSRSWPELVGGPRMQHFYRQQQRIDKNR